MKTRSISILGLVAISLFISCQGNNNDKASTKIEQEPTELIGEIYNLNSEASSLQWTGYHKGGINPRFGTLKSRGTIYVEHGKLAGGSIIIDMNSVQTNEKSIDIATTGGKTAVDMDAHLKNSDFFDTKKYPDSKFDITYISSLEAAKGKGSARDESINVSGNLRIKDKTVNITFPAKIIVTENEIIIEAKFTINRRDWGLTYGAEGDPKDWLISKDVQIKLNIKATKSLNKNDSRGLE